ncbi:hypothetical protein PTKIN_Ptkin08bG0032800 [Pterospermum kingtungense]
MEENPREEGRGGGGPTIRKSRYAIDEGGSGDLIECSGKHCRSCTAGAIADCVALCCCPCALVNLLTLALVKVPWKLGRRCLGLGKKKRNRVEMKRKCEKSFCNSCSCSSSCSNEGDVHNQFRHSNLREKMRVEQEIWEFPTGFEDEEEEVGKFSARFEAERVWLELYQVGHLGFGRVSFTGI